MVIMIMAVAACSFFLVECSKSLDVSWNGLSVTPFRSLFSLATVSTTAGWLVPELLVQHMNIDGQDSRCLLAGNGGNASARF